MSLYVMKFGGSSVGDTERMKRVAKRVVEKQSEGHQCVVVVSAMGDTTDELIDQAKLLNEQLPARELDMLMTTGEQISIALLSMAIQQLGHEAVSFTGWQAGFRTESDFGRARITDIQPQRVLDALSSNKIVVVAGFKGCLQRETLRRWDVVDLIRRRLRWRRRFKRTPVKFTRMWTAYIQQIHGS